jgi:hypothetical protein
VFGEFPLEECARQRRKLRRAFLNRLSPAFHNRKQLVLHTTWLCISQNGDG